MTENTTPMADPLDTNVNDIDTSYPVLPATHYMLKIEGAKVEPTKNNDGNRLTIPFRTVEKVQDKKGNEVLPGHQITHYIGVTERPEHLDEKGRTIAAYTLDSIKKSIARVAKAAGVSATVRQILDNPAMLDGKIVRAKVKVNKETDQFAESNSIASFDDAS